jgi:hypothetical protein
MIIDDLILLIEVEDSRCLVTFHGLSSIPYMMIRKGDNLEIEKLGDTKKVYIVIDRNQSDLDRICNYSSIRQS